MIYTGKSPTRVDLAGGTLDCWPLFLMVDDSVTVNLSIDIFTYAHLEVRKENRIDVEMVDINYRNSFANLEQALACRDPEMAMLQYHFKFWQPTTGFYLKTQSESPVGGGLGGSSSLTISLLKAFGQWFGVKWTVSEMVEIAHNLEAKVLKKPTGTQDYFPAIQSGLNLIEYGPRGPQAKTVAFPADYFKERMFLVYTGQPHHSGLNNWQVIKAAINGDADTMKYLKELKAVAANTMDVVLNGQWEKLPQLFKAEYQARIHLAESFSSPKIEALSELVLKTGGEAVKICGAGGGGCVLVWADPLKRSRVIEACQKEKFQVLQVQPAPVL